MKVVVFILLCSYVFGELILSNGNTFPSVSLGIPRNKPIEANISGFLVLADPFDGCSNLVNDVGGKIVITKASSCFPYIKAKNVQNSNGIALITFGFTNSLGATKFIKGPGNEDDIIIPNFEISASVEKKLTELIQSNPNISAVVSADINPRDVIYSNGFWIFFSVANGLINLFIILISGYQIICYLSEKRIFKVFTLANSLIFVGAIARLVDMIDYNGYYNLLGFIERTFLLAASLVLTLHTTVTIGFFWLDFFAKEKLQTKVAFLTRFKIHTAIALIVISVISLSISILTSLLINATVISLIGVSIYALFTLIIFIFFIYCCHVIRIYLKTRFLNDKSKVSKVMKKLFILGVLQCIGIGLYFLFASLLAAPLGDNLIFGAVMSTLLSLDATFISVVQLLMFPLQKKFIPCLNSSKDNSMDDNDVTKETFSQAEYKIRRKDTTSFENGINLQVMEPN